MTFLLIVDVKVTDDAWIPEYATKGEGLDASPIALIQFP